MNIEESEIPSPFFHYNTQRVQVGEHSALVSKAIRSNKRGIGSVHECCLPEQQRYRLLRYEMGRN